MSKSQTKVAKQSNEQLEQIWENEEIPTIEEEMDDGFFDGDLMFLKMNDIVAPTDEFYV